MSVQWIARVGSLLILFGLVGASARFLGNRHRYRKLLESTPLAVLEVALFNACCYLAAAVAFSVTYARWFKQGPLEAFMRRICG